MSLGRRLLWDFPSVAFLVTNKVICESVRFDADITHWKTLSYDQIKEPAPVPQNPPPIHKSRHAMLPTKHKGLTTSALLKLTASIEFTNGREPDWNNFAAKYPLQRNIWTFTATGVFKSQVVFVVHAEMSCFPEHFASNSWLLIA